MIWVWPFNVKGFSLSLLSFKPFYYVSPWHCGYIDFSFHWKYPTLSVSDSWFFNVQNCRAWWDFGRNLQASRICSGHTWMKQPFIPWNTWQAARGWYQIQISDHEWDSHANSSLGQVRETVLGRHPRNSYLHHVDLPHAACGLHRGISHQDQNHPPANFWDPIPCCHSWPKWDSRSTWICQEEWKHGFKRGTTTERLKNTRIHL